MAEVNNTKLIDAIAAMKKENKPQTQEAVLEEIVMNAKFLIPAEITKISEEEAKKSKNPDHNTKIKFSMILNTNKNAFFPAFTSEEELHKWNAEYKGSTIILSFDDYVMMISKEAKISGFVVDPMGANLVIDRRMAEDLKLRKEVKLNGSTQRVIKNGSKVKLGVPKEMPTELLDALKANFAEREDINKAYFRMMIRESGEASYLVSLDFTGDKDEVFKSVAESARPYLGRMFLDLIESTADLGKSVAENTEPFYVKQ